MTVYGQERRSYRDCFRTVGTVRKNSIMQCGFRPASGEQERDEWVVLLQGKASLAWADGK